MSGDNDSVVNNPLFGALIGTAIGNNAHAEADRIRSEAETRSAKNTADNGVMVATILSVKVDELRQEVANVSESEVSYICSIAGVRGVTRELLEELRKSDPNNPLLEKKIRDRIFDSSRDAAINNVKNTSNQQRRNLAEKLRDQAYGAEGSNKGGPEKSKITPNIQARAEAEVPSHTPDREKFLGLIEKLSEELKKANPNAPILQDKAMLDVFADYTINEMVRQEKNKPA